MKKEISSSQTFLFKVLFPCLWIPSSGFFCFKFGFDAGRLDWFVLLNWIGASIFVVWYTARLKSVRIDDDLLYIKDYRREISTPVTNITDVTESTWSNPQSITLSLREATEFGDEITFISQERFLAFWRAHPSVEELKKFARLDDNGV